MRLKWIDDEHAVALVTMRDPHCKCGCKDGRIETLNGQDRIFCEGCNRWCYNAPKTETGRAIRSIKTTHEAISTKQRARILLRDNGFCALCRKPESECVLRLDVSHVISVEDGHQLEMSDAEINSDENLVTLCDECNLGIGSETLPLRFFLKIIRARLKKPSAPMGQNP
jgi:5-methylcytosine-specific restriction endonuclease McrA